MFAHILIVIILIIGISYGLWKLIGSKLIDHFLPREESVKIEKSKIEKKIQSLKLLKNQLEETTKEVDVTKEIKVVEKSLKSLNDELKSL